MMEKVMVRFIKPHSMMIKGKSVDFRSDQIVEMDEENAVKLFKAGVILPGPQFGRPLQNVFVKVP